MRGKKEHCNIGTIGHVDHGKTTLTAAITKVLSMREMAKYKAYDQIDKTMEERSRGITIKASHVEYETKFRHYSHIDCPGHQNYIKNMITGAAQMDGVILVVSGKDGPQEQTKEHLILAREIGINKMVVYVNKLDMLDYLKGGILNDGMMVSMMLMETEQLLEKYGYKAPVVMGSARVALGEEENKMGRWERGGRSILRLLECVDGWISQPKRGVDKSFVMAIEACMSIKGRGTVVTGCVEEGTIKVGDMVDIVGYKSIKGVQCLGLEMFHESLEEGVAGDNLGVLLKGVGVSDICRGQVLVAKDSYKAYKSFEGKVYMLEEGEGGRKKGVFSGYKPQFFFRTANVTGTVTGFFDPNSEEAREGCFPGESMRWKVQLFENIGMSVNLRFTVREGGKTIGAGIVTKLVV